MKWEYCTLALRFIHWEHVPGYQDKDAINDPKFWSNGSISFFEWANPPVKMLMEKRDVDLEYSVFWLAIRIQSGVLGEDGWELFEMENDTFPRDLEDQWGPYRSVYQNDWHFKRELPSD